MKTGGSKGNATIRRKIVSRIWKNNFRSIYSILRSSFGKDFSQNESLKPETKPRVVTSFAEKAFPY